MGPNAGISELLIAVLVVVGGGVLAWAVLRRRRGVGPTEPACGRCGYAVRGLPTFVCPECGSDLRQVGIVTPQGRTRISLAWKLVAWTVFLPIPAVMVSAVVIHALPTSNSRQSSVTLSSPQSRGVYAVTIQATGRSTGATATIDRLKIQLTLPNQPIATLDAPWPAGPVTANDTQGRTVPITGFFGREVVMDWMRANGLNPSDPLVRAEAIQVADEALALAAPSGPGNLAGTLPGPVSAFRGHGSSGFTTRTPPEWGIPVAFGFWSLVWAGGVRQISRRHRRDEVTG